MSSSILHCLIIESLKTKSVDTMPGFLDDKSLFSICRCYLLKLLEHPRFVNGAVTSPFPGSCQGGQYKWLYRWTFLVFPHHATLWGNTKASLSPQIFGMRLRCTDLDTDIGASETARRFPTQSWQFPWVCWTCVTRTSSSHLTIST